MGDRDFRSNCKIIREESIDGAAMMVCKPLDDENGVPFRCPRDVKMELNPRKGAQIIDDGGCREETLHKLKRHVNNFGIK
jgi:hypothetical protein